jgi:LysR family transcriptional regulator for bpeEF and oprC
MDRLAAMQMFVRVVEGGSFSSSARNLGIGQSTISKQIAALETHLGAELIRRTSRAFALTESGRDFYDSAVRLLEDYEAATTRIGNGQKTPRGVVRAAIPPTFGRYYVVPRLKSFLDRYPEVTVDMTIPDLPASLVGASIDVAICMKELVDSTMIAQKIAEAPLVTVATRSYLDKYGVPGHPHELDRFPKITFDSTWCTPTWKFAEGKNPLAHEPNGIFRTADLEQVRVAVMQHVGMAQTPFWLFAEEIASGTVCRVLPEYEHRKSIYVLRPNGRRPTARIRLFTEFLTSIIASEERLKIL